MLSWRAGCGFCPDKQVEKLKFNFAEHNKAAFLVYMSDKFTRVQVSEQEDFIEFLGVELDRGNTILLLVA
jgi:hypothetical protein